MARARKADLTPKAARARRRFLRAFPDGFRDDTYVDWERDYKWNAHLRWREELNRKELARLLDAGQFREAAQRAVRIESATNLLFSFEKMALRDAVKSKPGAERFARGLFDWIHGRGDVRRRFDEWVAAIEGLPRRQTRVLTWPLVTVFGMIADPEHHIFLKPVVTKTAAQRYGFDFDYRSRPNWETYASLLEFAERVRIEQRDLRPRDFIDLQGFIWVVGSAEYD